MPRYDIPNSAPEPLRLVQRFVNTVDREHGREWLSTPDELQAWLVETGLGAGGRVGVAELRQAHELREALRALAAANAGAPVDAAAVGVVNSVSRASGVGVGLDEQAELAFQFAATGFDGALGRLLAIVFSAAIDGSWQRLKVCRQCSWMFYDYSKNRSASWCSMRLCGNRSKTRAYRARRVGGRS